MDPRSRWPLAPRLSRWWSAVLFPGDGQGPGAVLPAAVKHLPLLLAAALFFTRLSCPLLEPEETRYAEIPRQMLAEGRFVEPVWHGTPYYHKPPLLYWLVMASYSLFGVHDWAARLVPALAAVATVLVTAWWGRRLAGAWAGLLGAVVLCLSPRFVYSGRMLTMDGLLTLCVVCALAAAHTAVSAARLRRRWWMLSALACGLGVLTKGPVALALVVPPVLLFQALDRRACRPSARAWLAYLAVACGVAAPWYAAAAACDPAATVAFFWEHNVERYLAPVDHVKPLWFYVPILLTGMLPWSLLLFPLARLLLRRSVPTGARRTPALGFFLLASLWGLLFFSLSGCKRAGYILPALPPLALALGCYLAPLHAETRVPRSRFGLVGSASKPEAPAPGQSRRWRFGLVWGCPRWRFGLAAGTTFAVLLVAVYLLLPGYHRKFGLRGQVRRHQASAAPLPVLCYPHRWDSVSFYLQRDDVEAYAPGRRGELAARLAERPRTLVFVKSDESLGELLRALPPGYEFARCGREGGFVTAGVVRRRGE